MKTIMSHLKPALVALILANSSLTQAANYLSDPADYIHTPLVEEGEREIDTKFGTQSPRRSTDTSQSEASVGLGYGVNSWWFTEIYGNTMWNANTANFDAVEWENKFQLTEAGKYPVDIGLLIELERPQDRNSGYEAQYGLLFQSEWRKWQANLNLLLQGHYAGTINQGSFFGYQGQVKYRLKQEFELGAQVYSWLGQTNNWNSSQQQQTSAGPAIFGKTKVGPKQAIEYNIAFLWGTTASSPKNTIRTQIEYEF